VLVALFTHANNSYVPYCHYHAPTCEGGGGCWMMVMLAVECYVGHCCLVRRTTQVVFIDVFALSFFCSENTQGF
jgi:hypothetical protein